MIKERHVFWPTPDGKRDSMNLLIKARRTGYIVWATIFYEEGNKRHKFSDWVNNNTWSTVKRAIDRTDRDIRIYDISKGLEV